MPQLTLLSFLRRDDGGYVLRYNYSESLIHLVLKAYIMWKLRNVSKALSVYTECRLHWYGVADVCADMPDGGRVLVEIAVSSGSVANLAKKIASLASSSLELDYEYRIVAVVPRIFKHMFAAVQRPRDVEVEVWEVESLVDELTESLRSFIR